MNRQDIENAISTLENQRDSLDHSVIETSLTALRQQLSDRSHRQITSSALRGERRQVTVMFADISGFTAMSEKLDPEEVRSLINACFERLGEVIDHYGGHIDKFIGDEIMALFGAPIAHENDPERTLRAALEMMAALETFNEEFAGQIPKPLALHFGINSGLVIAGGIGTAQRQDYSVMGDTVNLAARLEDLSEAGEILVGENTFRLTAPLFEFEALPPVNLKGKSQPAQVYRLLRAKIGRGGQIRGIEGLSAPLVGRVDEVAQLEAALENFYQGHGRVISVMGEAGLGKTRLISEIQALCAQEGQAWWVDGRALSHADSASYLVARDVLRNLMGINSGMAPSEAANILRLAIQQVLPRQAADLHPYLAQLLEIPLDEQAQQRIKYLQGDVLHQRILQATQDFTAAKSQLLPLVLVFEDLHWADPSSLELLNRLLPLTHNHSLLLFLVYRQPIDGSKIWHFHQDLCGDFANRGDHQLIDLPPLTDDESHQLLDHLLGKGALPNKIQHLIVTKSEGNPFYLEEVIRSLIDSQAILPTDSNGSASSDPQDGPRWVARPDLDTIKLPDTLQGVIMARIDQLTPQTKRILQAAAVVGRTFPQKILGQVLDNPMIDLKKHLASLENLDLVQRVTGPPAMAYAFKHVFTQESVYDSLLLSDRRKIHLHVGQVLEDSLEAGEPQDADLPLMLAHHFEQGRNQEKAIKYLRQAAGHAINNYANREAQALYQRMLALLSPTDYIARWDMLVDLEKILDRLGEREQQADVLIQLQTLAELQNDDRCLAITHNRRAQYFDRISEYQAAAEAAEVGLRKARRSKDEHLQAESLNLLALTAWRRFDYRAVQKWAQQALDALKVIGDPGVRITSLFHLGKASYRLGQYDSALRYIRAAQTLTQNTDNRGDEATSHLILGWIYQRLGDYPLAEKQFQAKLAVRRTIGDRYGEAAALSHLGWLAYDQNTPDTGLAYCQEALAISRAIGDRENESYALSGMGLNHEQLGNLDAAAENYHKALAVHREIGAATLAIFDQAGLARIALARQDTDKARGYIETVVNWVLSGNAQKFWDPWIIYLSSYRVLSALGDSETAAKILEESHAILKQRANEISDESLQHCFLEKVSANKALIEAWQSQKTAPAEGPAPAKVQSSS